MKPDPITPICLPPAPCNGGPLESAPAKVGIWVWQPKIDDRRVVIHTPTRTVWNQYGELSVANCRDMDKFQHALGILSETSAQAEWLDAGLMEYRNDMMRGCIVVFDLITQDTPHSLRRVHLERTFDTLHGILPDDIASFLISRDGLVRNKVFLINQFGPTDNPMALQDNLRDQNKRIGRKFYEGLVAKKDVSTYPFAQRPKTTTPDWIKHRFDQ